MNRLKFFMSGAAAAIAAGVVVGGVFPVSVSASVAQSIVKPSITVQDAITRDPVADPAHPGGYEEVAVPAAGGSRMPGLLYLASGPGPHPTVLLLHGYPGGVDSGALAQAIMRFGWNVLTFQYRGLWGSPGAFSFSHAIEDTDAALAFLRDQGNADKYGIDRQRLVLIGHSMGGFLALTAASRHPEELRGVGVMSAVNIGGIGLSLKTPEDIQAVKEAAATVAPVAGTTPDALVAELQAHGKQWNLLDYAPALHTLPVLVVEAKDPYTSQNKAMVAALHSAGDKQVTERAFDTSHDFGDHGIALERTVLEWLSGL